MPNARAAAGSRDNKAPAQRKDSLWRDKFFLFLVACFLLLALLTAWESLAAEAAVSGILADTESGAVVLEGDDGALYTVRGQDLSASLGKRVRISGTVSTDPNGLVSISPGRVEVLEEVPGAEVSPAR